MSWYEKGLAEAAKSIGMALISVGIPALITWWIMDDDSSQEFESDAVQEYEDSVLRVMEFKKSGLNGQTKFLQNEGVDPVNYTRVIKCLGNYSLSTPITSEMVKSCEERFGL